MVCGFFSGANLFVAALIMLWKSLKKQQAFRVDIYLRGFVTKMTSNIDEVDPLKHVGSLIKLLRSYRSQKFLIVSDFKGQQFISPTKAKSSWFIKTESVIRDMHFKKKSWDTLGCLKTQVMTVLDLPIVISIHSDSKPSSFISELNNLLWGRSSRT